jgi:hypothetical protein
MPTQIRRPSAQALAPAAPDVNSNSLTPLTIIAILIFVLHLAAAAMLGRSQASHAIGPLKAGAMDDASRCAADAKPPERSLPFD